MLRTNENNELSLELELWPFHLDFQGAYPLHRVVSRMIHVAGEHATHYGFGIHQLMEMGATWVLSRLSIEFLHPIDVTKLLMITTGVHSYGGLTTERVLELAQEGRLIARALSRWVAIDLESRKPLPIASILTSEAILSKYDGRVLVTLPKQLWSTPLRSELQLTYKHHVRYSDLDINKHVNSSVWVALALDAIPLSYHQSYEVERAHLHFIREGHAGELLEVWHTTKEQAAYVEIRKGEEILFQLVIEGGQRKNA